MCLRILLWAIVLGFSGGMGGVLLASWLWEWDSRAHAWSLIVGATVGAAVGVTGVLLVHRRRPGDF